MEHTTGTTHDHQRFLDQLALWLERRFDQTVGWREGSFLYALTVLDRDGVARDDDAAVRITYLAHGWVYALLESPSAEFAALHDALGLCCFGTATHLDTLERRRCRTVLVASAEGQSAVNRLRHRRPELAGAPQGPVAELVRTLYTGGRSLAS